MNRRSMDTNLRSGTRKSNELPQKKQVEKKKRSRSRANPKETNQNEAHSDVQQDDVQIGESSLMSSAAETEQTTKKRKTHDALEYGGYTWHSNKTQKTKNGETTYYDCSKMKERSCKAKLNVKKTNDGSTTYKENGVPHQHVIDVRDKLVKERLTKAKEAAKTTTKPTRELYSDALAGAPEEIIPHMPKPGAFNKMVQTVRKGDHPIAPKTLNDLVLPEILTKSGENFVMFDNKDLLEPDDADDRIIMFATQRAMDFMANCTTLHMDGTVSSAPVLFDQIYAIIGNQGEWRVPLVYILCKHKKTTTYETMFKQLKKDQENYEPGQINVDFELAAMNAAKAVFPGAKIQFCFFHFKQSILRNLSTNGLKERYENDSVFSDEIRQMMAVAFLPVDDVISGWENLIKFSKTLNPEEQEKDKSIEYFVNSYFCKNYIGSPQKNGTRKRPRYAIEMWNVHQSTLNDLPRTNNVAEGWNNAFSTMTGAKRPTIFKFVEGLLKDEAIARAKMISCDAGQKPKPQKACDAERDAAIKNSVQKYVKSKEAFEKLAAEAKQRKDDDSDDSEMDDPEEEQSNQWSRSHTEQTQWKKSPAMMLLSAIGKVSTAD